MTFLISLTGSLSIVAALALGAPAAALNDVTPPEKFFGSPRSTARRRTERSSCCSIR